jgi:hypothetical protein
MAAFTAGTNPPHRSHQLMTPEACDEFTATELRAALGKHNAPGNINSVSCATCNA